LAYSCPISILSHKATNILQFMHDEGIIVFNNLRQDCDGIQGIDPVHVEFTDNLPARLKPYS